jgi:hypothetical protein
MEPTSRFRWVQAALLGAVAVVGVFGGFRLLYVIAASAVLVVAFTASELWRAWHEADRQIEAERQRGGLD